MPAFQPRSPQPWRPDGRDEASYPGWRDWCAGQWRWEFLRRNESFQQYCDDAGDVNDEAKRWQAELITAKSFKLKTYKHYQEQYETETLLAPEFELLRQVKFGPHSGSDTHDMNIFPGDVIVTFNVSQALGNTRLLSEQVAWYEHVLKQQLAELEKVQGRVAEKQNTRREPRSQLECLRLLDGIAAGLQLDEIAALVFPHKAANGNRWSDIARRPLQTALALVARSEI